MIEHPVQIFIAGFMSGTILEAAMILFFTIMFATDKS